MTLEAMCEACEQLLAALEEGEPQAILESQRLFSQAVETAWQAYQQGEIDTQVRGQAFPRVMHMFATQELPRLIHDPQGRPRLMRELRNFRQMVDIVASPVPKLSNLRSVGK